MKKPYPLFVVILLIVALGACSKSKDRLDTSTETPIYKGAIIGKVASGSPADLSVSIVDPTNGKVLTVKPDANGFFRFGSLVGANYAISIQVPGMSTMASAIKVELPASATVDVGILNFSGNFFTYVTGTGSISGKISPVIVGSGITAYREENSIFYQGNIDQNGNFVIPNLPYGNYSLNVSTGTGYTIIPDQNLMTSLATGQSADKGTVYFSDNSSPLSPNYIYFDLDGVAFNRGKSVSATYSGGNLNISSFTNGTQNNGLGEIKIVLYSKLELIVANVTAPGTYVCNGTNSLIRYSWRTPNPFMSTPLNLWSTIGTGGSGTVTITSIDVTNRTISGTFSATLVPENSTATGNRTITKGTFANFKY